MSRAGTEPSQDVAGVKRIDHAITVGVCRQTILAIRRILAAKASKNEAAVQWVHHIVAVHVTFASRQQATQDVCRASL